MIHFRWSYFNPVGNLVQFAIVDTDHPSIGRLPIDYEISTPKGSWEYGKGKRALPFLRGDKIPRLPTDDWTKWVIPELSQWRQKKYSTVCLGLDNDAEGVIAEMFMEWISHLKEENNGNRDESGEDLQTKDARRREDSYGLEP